MKIEIDTDMKWAQRRLTFIEEPSSMGDKVHVCLHDDGDDAQSGTTVKVYAADLIRAAKMLAVPHRADERKPES